MNIIGTYQIYYSIHIYHIYDKYKLTIEILCEFMRICSNSAQCANFVRIVRICSDFVNCENFVRIVRILCELCKFCANCVKNCSNFCTQKEHTKEQGPVRFFCANFMFVLKE